MKQVLLATAMLISTSALAQQPYTQFVCESSRWASFAVRFSEATPALYYRDSAIPADKFRIGQTEIYFEAKDGKDNVIKVLVNRLSGEFIATSNDGNRVQGHCRRVEQRQF
jgi:hypothetical protein